MAGFHGREKTPAANIAWAAFYAFAALASFAHFAAPAAEMAREALDLAAGKISYCAVAEGTNCVTFSATAWVGGIAGALAGLGFFAAFSSAAVHAWRSSQKRFAFELDKNAAKTLTIGFAGVCVSAALDAYNWFRLFGLHETALFGVCLAVASALAARRVFDSARNLSKGEAISIEIHRHAQ